jgi:hypothetical protein
MVNFPAESNSKRRIAGPAMVLEPSTAEPLVVTTA